MGARVTPKGQQMYDFLNSFVEFVLPGVREFPGLVIPAPSASEKSPSMTSGVVSCAFGPAVLELFPKLKSSRIYTRGCMGFMCILSLQREGRMLQIVLGHLYLSSRYPLFESNERARRALRLKRYPTGISTHVLPH